MYLSAAKHAFLDLEAVFSAGFVSILVEIIAPRRKFGACGLRVCRQILSQLVELGNRAASKRLVELDQMCAHLGTLRADEQYEDTHQILSQVFTFDDECGNQPLASNQDSSNPARRSSQDGQALADRPGQFSSMDSPPPSDRPSLSQEDPKLSFGDEDGIFGIFQPGLYTGEELADWEMFESQISGSDLA